MKANILKSHQIKTKTEDSKLFAWEDVFNYITNQDESKWIEVTNWSESKLYKWLGY
jgi:hypothetical protein